MPVFSGRTNGSGRPSQVASGEGIVTLELPSLQKFDVLNGKTFLICVGAMKCATSWIYRYLEDLPGVAVSPVKELHFFNAKYPAHALSDMDAMALNRLRLHLGQDGDPYRNLMLQPSFQASVDRAQMMYDDNAYFAHFARLCGPETQTLCDITPAYSTIGPDGFDYMRAFCATQGVRLRILFVMRDPVDRLWSQLRHITQSSPDTRLTERWAEALQNTRIMARTDYRYCVEDMDRTFPAEDILYLFYEDLFSEASLRRLSAFAGAEYRPGEPDTVEHKTELTLDLPKDARDAFLQDLGWQYDFCRARFGDQVPSSWLA